MNWNHTRDELKHQFEEWGVTGTGKMHFEFRKTVYAEAKIMVQNRSAPPTDYQPLKANTFPTDYVEALEFVYQSDLKQPLSKVSRYNFNDKLSHRIETGSRAPYRRMYSKSDPNHVYAYKRKPEYEGIGKDELDPFSRFVFTQSSNAETMFRRWFLSSSDCDAGTVFEARLACYALQSECCYKCKCRKSMRWHGGSGSSWQDLVCVVCESMYEVKTKASLDKVESAFTYNSIVGGSFSRYCALRNSLKPGQTMYLVVLPRVPTFDRSGLNECFPVYIAEIADVLPRLSPLTFLLPRIIKSVVSVNLHTKCLWFNLPRTQSIYYAHIMETLFIKHFSKQVFKQLEDRYFEPESDDDCGGEEKGVHAAPANLDKSNTSSDATAQKAKKSRSEAKGENQHLEKLRNELQSLKVGNEESDDWETMYNED